MSTIMPFDFLWCYEPEDDDEDEHCGCLLLGTPETVTPLHIDISNIISDKTITIHPIVGVTEADTNNYHFKLAFASGILVEPENIALETEHWSLYQETDNLYLLWIGEAITLESNQITEVILTGVAAQSAVRTTTTTVTISWQLKQGNIDIINISRIPGQNDDYATNTTLELEMIKTSGKSNIPLYVGFVGSNKVMNTYNETNSLQLRITNTNLPGIDNPNITFHYDSDAAQCSQLVIVLEVGTVNDVPWALGTKDQINNVGISLGEQWQKKGNTEEIKVGGVVKALQWAFIPKLADVVLQPQETLLIDLNNIVTAHSTGEANLYLRYQYIEGYKDGKFICQIEKAPLVFDEQVRIGTQEKLQGLFTVKDGISIDCNGQPGAKIKRQLEHLGLYHQTSSNNSPSWIELWGTQGQVSGRIGELCLSGTHIAFRSNSTENSPGNQNMILTQNGDLGIGTTSPSAMLDVQGDTVINGELNVQGTTSISNNLGIGTTSPSAKLDVQGDTVISGNTTINGNTTIPNGYLSFNQHNGQLIQLWDTGHTIGIQGSTTYFRTSNHFAWYKDGSHSDSPLDAGGGKVQMVIKDGNVGIGTNNPEALLDIKGPHAQQNTDSISILKLQRLSNPGVRDAQTVDFKIRGYDGKMKSHTQLDINLSDEGDDGNKWGYIADRCVMQIRGDGGVYIPGYLYVYSHQESVYRLLFPYDKRPDSGLASNPDVRDARLGKASDINLKKDIQTLSKALEKIISLRGVSFKWNDKEVDRKIKQMEESIIPDSDDPQERERILEEQRQKIREAYAKEQKGFIAQEIEKVFPEWVDTDQDGYKTVNFAEFVPVIVEAIKELQAEIETLKQTSGQPSTLIPQSLSVS